MKRKQRVEIASSCFKVIRYIKYSDYSRLPNNFATALSLPSIPTIKPTLLKLPKTSITNQKPNAMSCGKNIGKPKASMKNTELINKTIFLFNER